MKKTKTVQSYKNTAKETKVSSLKNTDTGFNDRARIKDQNKKDTPKNSMNSPWDFRCPEYDQRSSNFVNAGTHYGTAMRQPVGHKGNPLTEVAALPNRRVNTQQVDDLG